ncbi:CHRD domain-containing protein [Altererythrobacter sp. GH1-8]|uniref:CHRD domain-containing protein n=1 Tax=Altererythrobacter sp. GH1-8 TaxID=3349333 RepID=UPI00374D5B59
MRKATWVLAGLGALGLAGAGVAPALAQDEFAYIGTSLFGENETGGGADEEASGDFSAELNLTTGKMCYFLEVQNLEGFTAAHIHEGKKGADGPPVVTLELMGEDGDETCVDVDPELLKKIARRNANYYVNVHTEAFPKGAIRGQLDES